MRSVRAWRAHAKPTTNPERFSGPVLIHAMTEASEATDLETLAVYFAAGVRTLPHVHTTGQLLVFLEGEGVVGTHEGYRLYGPGGLAVVPAGEWHWHGATPSSAAAHLSIRPGGPTAWPPDVPMDDWEAYLEGRELS
jgi:quercetin dioxygenase-like cupin family protein